MQPSSSAFEVAWDEIYRDLRDRQTLQSLRAWFPDHGQSEDRRFSRLHEVILGIVSQDLEELLGSRPSIDVGDSEGRTPLSWAVWRRDAVATKLLLGAGASPNKPDNFGRPPLCYASDFQCIELLLQANVSVKYVSAEGNGILHTLPYLLLPTLDLDRAIHALVNAGIAIDGRNAWSETPLLMAVVFEIVDLTRALLDNGADIDALDIHDDTPLKHAILFNRHDNIKLLLQRGAKYGQRHYESTSILHTVAAHSNVDTLRILCTAKLHGIDTEIRNKEGRNPIQEAQARGAKPEGFIEKFEELLAGIRARNDDSKFDLGNNSSCEKEEPEDYFVDALEQQ